MALAIATACVCVGTTSATAADEPPKGDPIPFETLAIESSSAGINLWYRQILRVRPNDDLGALTELLAGDFDAELAEELVASIGDGVAPGQVVLIGEIDSSCTPADEAGLVRGADGQLEMFAPGHVPEPIECVVAVSTVAVLSVDADDAPPGSTDHAELVTFENLGVGADIGSSAEEVTAGVPDGYRRFSFVRIGCAHDSAELIVTASTIDARLEYDDPDDMVVCAGPVYYRVVFDLPAASVPLSAQLVER
jgi:hypothetical protein